MFIQFLFFNCIIYINYIKFLGEIYETKNLSNITLLTLNILFIKKLLLCTEKVK